MEQQLAQKKEQDKEKSMQKKVSYFLFMTHLIFPINVEIKYMSHYFDKFHWNDYCILAFILF